jgi:hypothetical protein
VFTLRRTTDAPKLALTREHEAIVRPRKGDVRWDAFDRAAYGGADLDRAAKLWRVRAEQELHSLALFTQLSGQLHLLGAPLDWAGAFARMIADEVRHTDLCLRMCDALGRPAEVEIDEGALHLAQRGTPRAHVRYVVLAAFCIGETISGRMFKRALAAATVPLAREVVQAILVDETFHGELGWELGALLMRDTDPLFAEERAALARDLPASFAHFARICCAPRGPSWARSAPEVDPGENFGTLSDAGYARAFFDGMEEDVVPGLEAIGLPEARAAYEDLVLALEGEPD